MKKYILSLIVGLSFCLSANAQIQFGVGASLVTDYNQPGIHGLVSFDIGEKYALFTDLGFHLPVNPFDGSSVSLFSLDFDLHYKVVSIGEEGRLDGLAGIQLSQHNFSESSATEDKFYPGITIGAYVTYPISNRDVFVEVKSVLGGISQNYDNTTGFVGDQVVLIVTAGVFF